MIGKNRTIGRLNEKLKVIKKSNINAKRQYDNTVSVHEKKLTKINKKKNQLRKENRKLSQANARMKKSIVKRNETIKIMLNESEELNYELNLLYAENELNDIKIQTEKDHKNRNAWPLFIVKVIIEMLDNGTPPSAISKNLESTCRLICPTIKIIELPSIDCIRKQRGVLRILTECDAMHMLAKNPHWRQLWFDGTSRRTVSMTTFAAGITQSNEMRPIIMQAAKVGLGESAVNAVEVMKEILDDGRECLERLKETCEREFPDYKHDIPPSSSVTLSNCRTSVLSSDACDTAQKTRRLTKDEIINEINDSNDHNDIEGMALNTFL